MPTRFPKLWTFVVAFLLILGGLVKNWLTPLTPAQRIAVESGLERDDRRTKSVLNSLASYCYMKEELLAKRIERTTETINERGFEKTQHDILYELTSISTNFPLSASTNNCEDRITYLINSKYKK